MGPLRGDPGIPKGACGYFAWRDLDAEGDVVHFREVGRTEEASSGVARLLIADDHALVREGLRTMLSGEDGLQIIAEANNGAEALSICREQKPDLVLMDVRMPVMDGLEISAELRQ